MDVFAYFVGIVVAIWLARRASSAEAAANSTRAFLEGRLAEFTRRIFDLEKEVGALRQPAAKTPVEAEIRHPVAAPPTPATLPAAAPPAPAPAAPPLLAPPITKPREVAPFPPPRSGGPLSTPPAPVNWKQAAAKGASFEEKLGTNWLNKIGVTLLVIGLAYLLTLVLPRLTPFGKVAMAYGLSLLLLAVGVVGEKRERYRIVARAVLGGGWAAIYLTTYAIHNVDAVKIVNSPAWGFVLLFAAAAAMVAHTLRYDSQVVTGFAYLLGFVSVGVSEIRLGTLIASAALAASLVIILWRRRWYVIEPFAIFATYLLHWLWLDQIYAARGHQVFPEFPASAALVCLYWLIWMVSYFLRQERSSDDRNWLTLSFFLNAGGVLALLHHQSFHPELRFWFLLVVAAIYLGLATLSRKLGRHAAYILTTTFGASLIAVAIPYRYSGARRELLWLVEAEVFLIAGWRLGEEHLRKLGWAAAGVVSVYVFLQDLLPRFTEWRAPDPALGWMLLAIALALYLDGCLAPRLLDRDASAIDTGAAKLAQCAATVFLLSSIWVAIPTMWVAVLWTLAAAALVLLGRRIEDEVLSACGHLSALLATVRLFFIHLPDTTEWHGMSLRLVTVGISTALIYVTACRIETPSSLRGPGSRADENFERYGGLRGAYTWIGTILVASLLWAEVTNAAISLAWGVFGLVLIETARALKYRPLTLQGFCLFTLSFGRIFFADLNGADRIGPVSVSVLTVGLLAAIYYAMAFTSPKEKSGAEAEPSPWMRTALLWFGSGAIAALARFELAPAWVAVGWALLAAAAYFLGRGLAEPTLATQSYAGTLLVAARCAFENFYLTAVAGSSFPNRRTLTVSLACAVFFVLLVFALRERNRRGGSAGAAEASGTAAGSRVASLFRWFDANAHHLFFFVPTILMTVLISIEVRGTYVTAAWGLEALVLFVVTLPLGERAFRWFSLALLLLCVGRIVAVDVWTLDKVGRVFSFMGLGAVLLLVSFLYARYREVMRRYL